MSLLSCLRPLLTNVVVSYSQMYHYREKAFDGPKQKLSTIESRARERQEHITSGCHCVFTRSLVHHNGCLLLTLLTFTVQYPQHYPLSLVLQESRGRQRNLLARFFPQLDQKLAHQCCCCYCYHYEKLASSVVAIVIIIPLLAPKGGVGV